MRGADSTDPCVPAAPPPATEIATGAVHRSTTSVEGVYTIPYLPPGLYRSAPLDNRNWPDANHSQTPHFPRCARIAPAGRLEVAAIPPMGSANRKLSL